MIVTAIVVAALQTVPPLPATKPPTLLTGADYARLCQSQRNADLEFCTGYTAGVNDVWIAVMEDQQSDPFYCLPENASNLSVSQMVARHIERDDDFWRLSTAAAVTRAMIELFPCGRIDGPTSGE